MRTLLGLITPLVAYAVITGLHVVTPTRRVAGYVRNERSGDVLRYRPNGKYVLLTSIVIWFALGYFDIVPYTWLYQIRWLGLMGAGVIGVVFSFVVVGRYPATGRTFLADLWFGRAKNPQIRDGFIDAKLWVYLVGVVMLQLNVLSLAAYHITTAPSRNYGFLAGAAMLTWFCFDYLTFEKVHLWTYDFIAERFGFKLGFGCLAFYPYFYAVSLWFTARLPGPGNPAWLTAFFVVLFLGGWTFTRGANMQKYFFKTAPDAKFLGIAPVALHDGGHAVLANGYWGLSRHINYLGEIVQAIAIALVVGHPGIWLVWLYPAYYVGLLFSRQADDDKVCRAKYGDLWEQYTQKVRYKIIPFVY